MTWAHYLLQVNIYLVIFYAFYKLLLDKETYFMLNRIYLIAAGMLSLTIPFMKAEWFMAGTANDKIMISADQLNMLMANASTATGQKDQFNWALFVAGIYGLGVLFFAARLLFRLLSVSRMIKSRPRGMAFSFLHRTVIDPALPGLETIHKHEEIHVRQYHTLDVLFFEALSIIVWCNPVIYLYKESIKNIHEYLADEEAALFQGDKESYAMLLLSKAFGIDQNILTNSFFSRSLIKKRIFMLNKQRSKKAAVLKYGLFLPLFAIMLLFSSATISRNEEIKAAAEKISSPLSIQISPDDESSFITNSITSNPADTPKKKRPPLKKVNPNATGLGSSGSATVTPNGEKVYDFVSVTRAPGFPGGMEKFYKYLSDNFKYPEEAQENNVQGKVFLSFIVETDGTLNDIKVEKKLGSGTDEEALRLLRNSPKWIPGYSGDEPVRVKYNLPINFSLTDDTPEKPSASIPVHQDKLKFTTQTLTITGIGETKNPLYYIDGVRTNVKLINQMGPDEIESINIIKDKAAAEIYGEGGKDGVILITTKKGKLKNTVQPAPVKKGNP
jgi:TonB family protein